MCIRDSLTDEQASLPEVVVLGVQDIGLAHHLAIGFPTLRPVSYTHLRAHETVLDLVCRLLLEKKKHMDTRTNTPPYKLA